MHGGDGELNFFALFQLKYSNANGAATKQRDNFHIFSIDTTEWRMDKVAADCFCLLVASTLDFTSLFH